MRYFIRLAFDGTPYVGWQSQPNGISVQEVLETQMHTVLREKIAITGCGRTDTGVHARQYYAHFDTDAELPGNFVNSLNALIGPAIAVQEVFPVAPDLHARFSAKKRTYKYFVHFDKDPFREAYSFQMQDWKPDLFRLNELAILLIGEQDFTAFEKKGGDNKTSLCHVFDAYWETQENGLVFTITANRFLRNMVRAITGTLLSVALDKMDRDSVRRDFETKVQLNVKIAVPAKGLFLWEVEY